MANVAVFHKSLTVRMDLKSVLEEAKHQTIVYSSVDAVEKGLEGKTLDLILLDPALVQAGESRALQEFVAKHNGSRILLLGSQAESDPEFHVDAFCPMPYDRAQLLEFVDRLLPQSYGSQGSLSKPGLSSRNRILAVDDSPTYLHSLAEQLRSDNFEVLSAPSGEAALELLQTNFVDCILLDLIMARLSGQATCRRIRSIPALRSVPVIMLTALEDRQAMLDSFAAGADDFVSKSSDFAVLKARLTAQLNRRRDEQEMGRIREELHQRELETAEAHANRVLAETRASLLENLQQKNSELERREEELKAAKAIAEEANAAKDQFLAALSHELRTPLTPVLAAVQLMQRKKGLADEERLHLEIIRRNLELEARLIDDLLDLTRIVRGKIALEKKAIDVRTVIDRVVDICMPDIEARKLHFGVNFEFCDCVVNADSSRLQQVFWNLLKNSIKFTPDGGCVGIRGFVEGKRVIVEVTDTGIGIAPDVMQRIFSAFEQANQRVTRQFGGLGLGLAISKRLVEMHEGTIDALSAGEGQGATFRVALPRVETAPEAEIVKSDKQPASAPGAAAQRILLVEDHGDTAAMMQRLLEGSGYQVERAGDVKQALAAVAGRHFDLMISDLGLPDRSGLELMREIRGQGSKIKSIALSGYGREEDIQRSMEAGFTEHLIKPVDFEELARAVERQLIY